MHMPDINGNLMPGEPGYFQAQQRGFASQFDITGSPSQEAGLYDIAGNFSTPGTESGGNSLTDMFSGALSNDQGGQGWLAPTLGAASGVAQTFLGFKQLSEGKKQNRISNNQWQAQFDIQKSEYDRRTAERAARVAASNANRDKASLGG